MTEDRVGDNGGIGEYNSDNNKPKECYICHGNNLLEITPDNPLLITDLRFS